MRQPSRSNKQRNPPHIAARRDVSMRTESRKVCYRTRVLSEFQPVSASFGAFSISFSPFGVGFERHFEARSESRAHRTGCAVKTHDTSGGAHDACAARRPLVRHGRTALKVVGVGACRSEFRRAPARHITWSSREPGSARAGWRARSVPALVSTWRGGVPRLRPGPMGLCVQCRQAEDRPRPDNRPRQCAVKWLDPFCQVLIRSCYLEGVNQRDVPLRSEAGERSGGTSRGLNRHADRRSVHLHQGTVRQPLMRTMIVCITGGMGESSLLAGSMGGE